MESPSAPHSSRLMVARSLEFMISMPGDGSRPSPEMALITGPGDTLVEILAVCVTIATSSATSTPHTVTSMGAVANHRNMSTKTC